jgi:hypothetical protein
MRPERKTAAHPLTSRRSGGGLKTVEPAREPIPAETGEVRRPAGVSARAAAAGSRGGEGGARRVGSGVASPPKSSSARSAPAPASLAGAVAGGMEASASADLFPEKGSRAGALRVQPSPGGLAVIACSRPSTALPSQLGRSSNTVRSSRSGEAGGLAPPMPDPGGAPAGAAAPGSNTGTSCAGWLAPEFATSEGIPSSSAGVSGLGGGWAPTVSTPSSRSIDLMSKTPALAPGGRAGGAAGGVPENHDGIGSGFAGSLAAGFGGAPALAAGSSTSVGPGAGGASAEASRRPEGGKTASSRVARKTCLHLPQRNRTPWGPTFSSATRKRVLHSGQRTFMRTQVAGRCWDLRRSRDSRLLQDLTLAQGRAKKVLARRESGEALYSPPPPR